jgi:hypothetical protein
MTFYEPVLTLTLLNQATGKWQLKIEIYYPAFETGRNAAEVVVGGDRRIEVDVVADSSIQQNHVVTFTEIITREQGESEVTVTVKKGGKKKGEATVLYSSSMLSAA